MINFIGMHKVQIQTYAILPVCLGMKSCQTHKSLMFAINYYCTLNHNAQITDRQKYYCGNAESGLAWDRRLSKCSYLTQLWIQIHLRLAEKAKISSLPQDAKVCKGIFRFVWSQCYFNCALCIWPITTIWQKCYSWILSILSFLGKTLITKVIFCGSCSVFRICKHL